MHDQAVALACHSKVGQCCAGQPSRPPLVLHRRHMQLENSFECYALNILFPLIFRLVFVARRCFGVTERAHARPMLIWPPNGLGNVKCVVPSYHGVLSSLGDESIRLALYIGCVSVALSSVEGFFRCHWSRVGSRIHVGATPYLEGRQSRHRQCCTLIPSMSSTSTGRSASIYSTSCNNGS